MAREATSFLSNKYPLIALNCRKGHLTEHYGQVKRSKVHYYGAKIMPFNIDYTTLDSLHNALFGTFPHLLIENNIPARIMQQQQQASAGPRS